MRFVPQWRKSVNQRWIEDTVKDYVSSLNYCVTRYQIHDCDESESLFCCIHSPCLAAFFSIVPRESHIEAFVPKVEDEIRVWRDKNNWKNLDLNLVLLLENPETTQVFSDLRRDTTLCRKFAFFSTSPSDLRSKFAYLPFTPLDTGKALSLRVLSLSPEALLRRGGANQEFAQDLVASRPGAQALADKVTTKDYLLTGKADMSFVATTTEEWERSSSQYDNQYKVLLESVSLTNFRGIGRRVDLPLGEGITVVFGSNGTGKTSICDAIEWAVVGSIARVEKPDGDARTHEVERSIINYFASDQSASVELKLKATGGYVRRSISKSLTQSVFTSKGNDDWGAILTATQSLRRPGLDLRRARGAFRSSHILEQSTIRDFLFRDPVERFEALNRILGYEDLVRLTSKLRKVRWFVDDALRQREPERSEALQKLREREAEAEAIEKSIKDRESAVSFPPASDRVFKEVAAEAKAYLPTPEPPDVLSKAAMKQWLTDATEALAAVANSLKDTLEKVGGYLRLAEEVVTEKKDTQELKTKISTVASVEKKLREKISEMDNNLERITSMSAEIEANLNSIRRDLAALQWVSSNSVNLRQEEHKMKAEQEELIRVDEQVHKRQVELQHLQDRLNTVGKQVAAKMQELKKTVARRSAIEELIKLRQEWSHTVDSLRELNKRKDDLARRIDQQEKDVESLLAGRTEARGNYTQLRKQVEAEEVVNSRRAQLLAELRQTLSAVDKACPFCGFKYEDHADLLRHMEKVEESPSEVYQLALAKAQQTEKKLSLLEDEIKEKQNVLNILRHRSDENVQCAHAAKIRLLELRDKASILGILSNDADEGFVPEEAQLHAALAEASVSSVKQVLDDLKLEEQNLRSGILRMQEVIGNLTMTRQATDASIRERHERINSLHMQASEESAIDFLALPEIEVQERITRLQKTIIEKTGSIHEFEVAQRSVDQERTSILQRADNLQRQLEQWQLQVAVASQRETNLKASLLSIGVEGGVSPSVITTFQSHLEARISKIHQLHKSCSILAEILQLETMKEELSRAKENVEHEKNELASITNEIKRVKEKLSQIDQMSKAFQELTVMDMTETLKALSAPLNNIFERLNGHPLFGALRIEPNKKNKTVTFRVETPHQNSEKSSNVEIPMDVPPRSYLSDAQLNIVALSIFLSIALYQTWSKFKLIVIDDPVQQMDDLNAASFIDLIREVSIQNRRQFVITTCNDEFYRLALSKLSCLNTRKVTQFRAYRLEGLRQEGPEIIVDAPYWDNDEVKECV